MEIKLSKSSKVFSTYSAKCGPLKKHEHGEKVPTYRGTRGTSLGRITIFLQFVLAGREPGPLCVYDSSKHVCYPRL